MAAISTLKTLVELSDKDIDEAALKLSAAVRHAEEMEQKLALLEQYQSDYMARFQANLSTGVNASGYRNYQAFLDKLSLAVAGQAELFRHATARMDQAKATWQAASRKQKSFTTLVSREDTVIRRLQNRREQQATDEHASRSASRPT